MVLGPELATEEVIRTVNNSERMVCTTLMTVLTLFASGSILYFILA